MGASVMFNAYAEQHDHAESTEGKLLVNLFLDVILRENCSEHIRQAFIAAMIEAGGKG
jgi:hypothetical protein